MFKNYFLLTKNKNKNILSEVFTAKWTHNNKQTRFSMYHNDSSLVYIVTISWTYKYHITNITSYTRLISQWFPYKWHIGDIYETQNKTYTDHNIHITHIV